jgi:hypothetical protein
VSAADVSVGYPVHAVAEYREWTNPHRARFVDWKAACGATGTATGSADTAFGRSGSARKAELCRTCWPAGHATSHPRPRQIEVTA